MKQKQQRNNDVTVTYNICVVTKKKGYKEMRDRVAAATGLDSVDIAHIFGPAYGEFYNWIETRRKALATYEESIIEQTLALLNGRKSNPVLTSDGRDITKTKKTRSNHNSVHPAVALLIRYKQESGLSGGAVGKMLGVSSTSYYNWIGRGSNPKKATITKIETFLRSQGYTLNS